MRSIRLFAVVVVVVLTGLTPGLPALSEAPSPQEETFAAITPYTTFVGITPCRLVDTREAGFPAGYGTPALIAGGMRTFVVPEPGCGIPATAKAVSMNVTVVNAGGSGFLAVWPGLPADIPNPLVSSLNYVAGDVVPNAVVVPLNAAGQVTVLTVAAHELLMDVNGYFAATPATEIVNVPSGGIAATTVQAAINELGAEKVNASGWTAGRIMVTSTGGNVGVDTQLTWDDVTDVQAVNGSFKATGAKGRSILASSPGLALVRTNATGVTLNTGIYGQLEVTATTAGIKNIYIPLPIPTQLFGTATRLVSVKVCYKTSNATSYIYGTNVRTVGDDLVGSDLISDATDYASTVAACYTVSEVTPLALAGALFLYMPMSFAEIGHTITIGKIEVTLDQI